jgi:hypothetical protein
MCVAAMAASGVIAAAEMVGFDANIAMEMVAFRNSVMMVPVNRFSVIDAMARGSANVMSAVAEETWNVTIAEGPAT